MTHRRSLGLLDTHAGGDVSRIVLEGIGPIPGASVREQMLYLQRHGDGLRRLLLFEPYGIPEMSVDLVVPACDPRAAAGYIIMEVMGYPIYSGSNTICTATALLESGYIPLQDGEQKFKLESPAGLVDILAHNHKGHVQSITIQGLPSYIAAHDQQLEVPGLGRVNFSIAYSGGFYALVDATELGFTLIREEEPQLAACACQIVEAIRQLGDHKHPQLGHVGPLPFLHFMGPVEPRGAGRYRSRSATYVHPGVICRSTTGTGTAARLALMHLEQGLVEGDELETVSLRNSSFVGCFKGEAQIGGAHRGVESTITGKSHILARSEILVDPEDPLVNTEALMELFHS